MRFATSLVALLPPVLLIVLLAPIQHVALSAPLFNRINKALSAPRTLTISELMKPFLIKDHLSLPNYDLLVRVASKARTASREDASAVVAAIKSDNRVAQADQTDDLRPIEAHQLYKKALATDALDRPVDLRKWYCKELVQLLRLKFKLALFDAVLDKAGEPAYRDGLRSLVGQMQDNFESRLTWAQNEKENAIESGKRLNMVQDNDLPVRFNKKSSMEVWVEEAFGLLQLENKVYLKTLRQVYDLTRQRLAQLRDRAPQQKAPRRQVHLLDAFTPRMRPQSGDGLEGSTSSGATSSQQTTRSEIEPLIELSGMSTGRTTSSTPVGHGSRPRMQRQDSSPLIDLGTELPPMAGTSQNPFEAGQSQRFNFQQPYDHVRPPWDT